MFHIEGEYDYRYNLKYEHHKLQIVDTLRRLVNRMVEAGERSKQVKTFWVPRANLKIYTTLKTEAASGIWRRPENEFLVDDHQFDKLVSEAPAHFLE